MVLQSFSFVAFISDEKKVWQKKNDNGKLFSHFDLFLKVAYQNKYGLTHFFIIITIIVRSGYGN